MSAFIPSTPPAPPAADITAADEIRRCLELDGHKWTDKARDDWARIIAAHRADDERDAARADAERLALFAYHSNTCRMTLTGKSCDCGMEIALAAHRAASGSSANAQKAVTE